jgi:starvation-inducible DNA-binding protein
MNTMNTQTRFESLVSLPVEERVRLGKALNATLANTFDLYTHVKQAHWNIRGRHFIARHEFFDDLAEHLIAQVDDIAERAAAYGVYVRGTSRMVAEQTAIPDYDTEATNGLQHLRVLASCYKEHNAALRKGIKIAQEIGDPACEDLYTECLRINEIDMWFVASHLEE